MEGSLASLARLLSDAVLPTLKAVQATQAEQIAANARLERAIEELRTHIDAQFALLSSRLAACRIELLATQSALKAAQASLEAPGAKTLIH